MPEPTHAFDEREFRDLLEAYVPHTPYVWSSMAGGASSRRYFRVTYENGRKAVAMFVPEGAKAEELEKSRSTVRWPFLEVRDLLAGAGVRVPSVYLDKTDRGWLLLEDLGDDTLANYLAREPSKKTEIYKRAVADLAAAQQCLALLPSDSVVRARVFDHDLLLWEIQHFREWGLSARGIELGAEDRTTFDALAERLAAKIASWPKVFVHRDYQSRNLMVNEGNITWIDFQDALLGPRVYDLVALLNDSYQVFDRDFVDARIKEFAVALSLDPAAIATEFDTVTVQRKLKDAGRFVFIDRVKNNSSFLPFVEPTIEKVFLSLGRLAKADADMAAWIALLNRVLKRNS
jgi:aminoglycoside/choline kinase family phosphotransferase